MDRRYLETIALSFGGGPAGGNYILDKYAL
jgi:hypothetical protein